MKFKIYVLIFVIINLTFNISLKSQSDNVGNEWINYDQEYYKLHVVENGLYRVTYTQLVAAGVPVNTMNLNNMQLFHNGEEQYIYIYKAPDEQRNFTHIEFYGKKNNAELDKEFFDNPNSLVNENYSYYNDTAVYFLTWNNLSSNRRMTIENSSDFGPYITNKQAYCYKNIRTDYTGMYHSGSTRCFFTSSKGWFDNAIISSENSGITKTLSTPNQYTLAGNVYCEVAVAGTPSSTISSAVEHRLRLRFLNKDTTYFYSGYNYVRDFITIPASTLTGSSIVFSFSCQPNPGQQTADRNAVSYISVKYPHTWNFSETPNYLEFFLPENNSTTKDYIEISGFNSTSDVVIYDMTSHQRIAVQNSAGIIKALVNSTNKERLLIIINDNGYKSISRISKVSNNNKFINYAGQNPNANYIIVTHSKLLQACNEYASYRNSTGYNSIVVDVDQLYNQFAYGVEKHPAAIKRYIKKLHELNPSQEKFMFLVGKSIHNRNFRNSINNTSWRTNFANCLVPSAGYLSSDNLITSRIATKNCEPLVGTGRLSVNTSNEVIAYLNKVKAYESNPTEEWMKNIIHFGGGNNSSEQTQFANYLKNYRNVIEGPLFGATVKTFLKTSSDHVVINKADSIANLINNGVSMMTFFGHGNLDGFDQNIDSPDNFNNIGKFPFILANSCYSGDIHTVNTDRCISELWVNNSKGAIAFLASVGQGMPTSLDVFSLELYKNITYKKYHKPLALQIKNTIKELENDPRYMESHQMEITCHEFTLNGDPAIVVNSNEKPDLVIKPEYVSFIPNDITTVLENFQVKMIIKNIGKAVEESFQVSVARKFPIGNDTTITLTVNGCNYSDTLYLTLPVDRINGPGLNSLRIIIDPMNNIDEITKTNNSVEINFLIKSTDIFPVFPYEYAIYPNKKLSLIASTGDHFLLTEQYIFQIDTSDYFINPLSEQIISSAGGTVSWELPFDLSENTVYYWRVGKYNPIRNDILWRESSFIYEEGEQGWSQAHYYQFKKDDYRFIEYNRNSRLFTFVTVPKMLKCHNIGGQLANGQPLETHYNLIGWNIDGSYGNGQGDRTNCNAPVSMIIAVIDPLTLEGWPSNKFPTCPYTNRGCPYCPSRPNSPTYFYTFNLDATSSSNMAKFLNDIPNDHYILAYTWGNCSSANWTQYGYPAFESLGASNVKNAISAGLPYIFFVKKGNNASAQEVIGTHTRDTIDFAIELRSNFTYGNIQSVEIGPAAEWKSLHWDQKTYPLENPDNDEALLSVYGIKNNGTKEIISNLSDIKPEPQNLNIYTLGTDINYQTYPKIALDFYTKDEITNTPAQLKKWQVKFKEVAETAIDPKLGYHFCCDTLYEGDLIEFAIATKNISSSDMDSLAVKYWLQTDKNKNILLDLRKLKKHPAGDIIIDTIKYSTLNLSNLNSIWIEYNPIDTVTGTYYQNEQYHFNNLAVKYFYVKKDITNPLLDVSFDGRYIMNGEIVSAKPEILIKLKDENKYLALNDTALFKIFITNTTTQEEKRIYFTNILKPEESLEWTPASLPNNSCKIIYRPTFTEDGIYRLRVQAKDISNNFSGANDYVIEFEIITQSTISHLLNYPNPFSTNTRFVFELTGSELPDDLRIEIFTISGKLVKVIYLDELGPIRIGRNITEYAWDGKDMYGDRLANGVYFYRVKAKINGKTIDKKTTEADKYFKHDIGKMYLLR